MTIDKNEDKAAAASDDEAEIESPSSKEEEPKKDVSEPEKEEPKEDEPKPEATEPEPQQKEQPVTDTKEPVKKEAVKEPVKSETRWSFEKTSSEKKAPAEKMDMPVKESTSDTTGKLKADWSEPPVSSQGITDDRWAKAESESKKRKDEKRLAELNEHAHPKRLPIHKLFLGVGILMSLAALGMLAGQIVGLASYDLSITEIVLRVYVIALCGIFILVEMEITKFARESIILRNWTSRGFLYGFIGVLGLDENESIDDDDDSSGFWYMKVVAWIMVGCGVVYFLMGFLCVQGLYIAQREDFEARTLLAWQSEQSGRNGSSVDDKV